MNSRGNIHTFHAQEESPQLYIKGNIGGGGIKPYIPLQPQISNIGPQQLQSSHGDTKTIDFYEELHSKNGHPINDSKHERANRGDSISSIDRSNRWALLSGGVMGDLHSS